MGEQATVGGRVIDNAECAAQSGQSIGSGTTRGSQGIGGDGRATRSSRVNCNVSGTTARDFGDGDRATRSSRTSTVDAQVHRCDGVLDIGEAVGDDGLHATAQDVFATSNPDYATRSQRTGVSATVVLVKADSASGPPASMAVQAEEFSKRLGSDSKRWRVARHATAGG